MDTTLDLSHYDLSSLQNVPTDRTSKSRSILELLQEFSKKPVLTSSGPQDHVQTSVKSPIIAYRTVRASRVKHKSGSGVQETISTINLPFQRNLLNVLKPTSPSKVSKCQFKFPEEPLASPENARPAKKEICHTEGNDPVEPVKIKNLISLKEPASNQADLSLLNRRQIKSFSTPINPRDDAKRVNLPNLCSHEVSPEPTSKASIFHSPKPSLSSLFKYDLREKISSPSSLQGSTVSTLESIGKKRSFFFPKHIETKSSIFNYQSPSGKALDQRRHTEVLETKTSIDSPTFPSSGLESPLLNKIPLKKHDSKPGRKVVLRSRKETSTDITKFETEIEI